MPWPVDAPFFNFNSFSILLNAKPQWGVYGLFTADHEAMLIDAGEVMTDLLRLAESGDRALRQAALFRYVLAGSEESLRLKAGLIAELLPRPKSSRAVGS